MSAPVCRRCPAKLLWARMPSGKRNPLDKEPTEVAAGEKLAGKGLVAFNPATSGGASVVEANEADVRRWVAAGQVSLHLSHFATCPARAHFRRKGAR